MTINNYDEDMVIEGFVAKPLFYCLSLYFRQQK